VEEFDEIERGFRLPGFLLDPIGVLRRRWLWMLVTLLVGIAVATVVATQWKPTYLASAKILLVHKRIPEEFVRSTILENAFDQFFTYTAEVLALEQLPELISTHELYRDDQSDTPMTVLAKRMRDRVTVNPVGGYRFASRSSSPVFEIAFEDADPRLAAAVANDIVARLMAASIESRDRQARVTTEFMRRELRRADEALRFQGKKIAEFRAEHRGELPEELATNLAKLDRLQQQRQSLFTQIGEAEGRLASIAASGPSELAPDVRLLKLRDQLRHELSLHTEEHPNVIALQRQIAFLETERSGEGSAALEPPQSHRELLIAETRRDLSQLRKEVAEVNRALEGLDARVARTPALDEELASLLREEDVLHENYMDYLRKVKEAELAESLESSQQGVRLSRLEAAHPPTRAKLPRWQILLGGYAGSLGLALLVGVFLELRAPVLTTADELEAITGVRTLGSVPKVA
jgi:uncharacterized protein involved in exopolysaccharide biosynthesis